MAAIEVGDGVNDGPDASVLVVHIATEGFRDVGRYESPAQGKRAERCGEGHSKHSPGAGVALRGQSPCRCGIDEASPKLRGSPLFGA